MEEGWARVAVVVEDDEDIRELIMLTLQQAGFTVHPAATGAQGVALTKTHTPDVITVDVSLPDIDGIEVTRRLRTFSSAVVVMVSARGEEADTLLGLEGGADEYVTKPFRPRELRARIEALLRRAAHTATTTEPAPAEETTSAPRLVVDAQVRTATLDGDTVPLTRTEFDLLAVLHAAGGRPVAKGELARALWPDQYAYGASVTDADRRTVEVHMANLRRKLGESPTTPRHIHTVRGLGYRLAS